MYIAGQEEIDALARVIRNKALFRYGVGDECDRFEARYAKYLGVKHFALAASGSKALAAAMTAVGLGPGDEVLIPAHTYMATATSVLAVGAIPVIVDIDESITIDPQAVEDAIGPRTKAVVPVHMWGAACDMNAIMEIAERRGLIVIEDACQGVGGGYEGRKIRLDRPYRRVQLQLLQEHDGGGGRRRLGQRRPARRARPLRDRPVSLLLARPQRRGEAVLGEWRARLGADGRDAERPARPPRRHGLRHARREEDDPRRARSSSTISGLRQSPMNSPDHDCATQVMYTLPSAEAATAFTKLMPSVICGKTGRHTYTEWDQVLMGIGAAHPAMNPYLMPANAECRKAYSKDMCAHSLDILNRTVMVATNPEHSEKEIADIVHNIGVAARVVLGGLPADQADLRDRQAGRCAEVRPEGGRLGVPRTHKNYRHCRARPGNPLRRCRGSQRSRNGCHGQAMACRRQGPTWRSPALLPQQIWKSSPAPPRDPASPRRRPSCW